MTRSDTRSRVAKSRENRDSKSLEPRGKRKREARTIRQSNSRDSNDGIIPRTTGQAVRTKTESSSRPSSRCSRISGRSDTSYRDDVPQSSTPGKRKLTRSSCVLQLVDQRKSTKVVPEVRAITTRSSSKTEVNTRSRSLSKQTVPLPGLETNFNTPKSRDSKIKSPRALRSRDGVSRSNRSSPASVSSNSDRILRKVSVPRSDRVLRGQRRKT